MVSYLPMNPKKAKSPPKTRQKPTSAQTAVAAKANANAARSGSAAKASSAANASHSATAGASAKAAARQLPAARSVGDLAAQAEAEHRAWLRKYLPVEQRILAERERLFERRAELRAERRARRAREFGDLCEWTEGDAARWREHGFAPLETMFLELFRDAGYYMYLDYVRCWSTQRIDRARGALRRPLYYARENERRRALAAARRRIERRRTENPCPTKEQVLDAWLHAKDSHEAAIRFGGMLEDLECYLDNSLARNDDGVIVGRAPGIKGWLKDNIPALYLRYTAVMRYKAAAKKFRQIAGLVDPTPVSAAVPEPGRDDGKLDGRARKAADGAKWQTPEAEVVRAAAIWREVSDSAGKSATALIARIDALVDPEAVEDANMLREWRERYEREITVRTKSRWWRRLMKWTGKRDGGNELCAAKGAG